MRIRCPHCHNPLEIVDESPLTDVVCSSCRISFSLVSDSDETLQRVEGDTDRPDGQRPVPPSPDKPKEIAHFQLHERLGTGAFGTVWRATDTQLDRTVAIKMPRKGQLDAAESEQFLREARAAAQLRHAGIVSVHEVGRQNGQIYIVSDFVPGTTLADRLTEGPLSATEATKLCIKITDALHHAHEQGVVHRDLKPSNIMLDDRGNPHVMDFGLAKREAAEITMTVEGQLLGTPAYMPPEQASGSSHEADQRSDVYSLGVVLFELLTGERPFRGNLSMLLQQVVEDDAPSPRKLNYNIPRDLETICLKCLEKDPQRRYQTMEVFGQELRRHQNNEPIHARPIGRAERTWRWCKRKPSLAGLCAVAMILLLTLSIGGPVVAIQQSQHATRERENAHMQTALRAEATRHATAASEQAQRATAAAGIARTRTNQALGALHTVIFDVQRELGHVPGTGAVRRKILRMALRRLQLIADEFADTDKADFETMVALMKIADVFLKVGVGGDDPSSESPSKERALAGFLPPADSSAVISAHILYQRAHDIAKKRAAAKPDDREAKDSLATSYRKLMDVNLQVCCFQDAFEF